MYLRLVFINSCLRISFKFLIMYPLLNPVFRVQVEKRRQVPALLKCREFSLLLNYVTREENFRMLGYNNVFFNSVEIRASKAHFL